MSKEKYLIIEKKGHDVIRTKYSNYSNVGQLLDFIKKNNIPRSAKILVQRVEDVYFEKSNWETINKRGEAWYFLKKWNEEIDEGKYLDKKKYPKIKTESLKKYSEEELENSKEKYYIVWSPVKYGDDDNLYLDAHY